MISRSKIIEHLKDQEDMAVVYHYCDFQDTNSTSPATILLNIFTQLLPINGSWIKDFSDLVLRKDTRQPPPTRLEDIYEMVRRASKYHQHVTVAVDALDECNESREDLLKLLLGLEESISTLVTSRKEYDISEVFLDKPSISLYEERSRIEADMKAYIDDEFQKRSRLNRLPVTLKTEVGISLIEKADGM